MSAHFCYVQIILNWLGGQQNFTVGATLYKTFGTDEAFKEQLSQGESPDIKKRLAEELQQLVRPMKKPEHVLDIAVRLIGKDTDTDNPQPETSEMPLSADEVLQAIRNEWHPLYQRMNLLRYSLDKYGSDNSPEAIEYRKPIAFEIRQLEKECNAIWAKRDYYLKEGKLPFGSEKKFEIPTDPVKLAMLINNIKKSIRTNRKLMKDHPGNPKYAQLYNQYKEKHKLVTGKDYEEKE